MKNIITAFLILFGVSNLFAHAIKMTTAKLEIDNAHKTCSLTINFFIDDFESEMIKMYPQEPFDYENSSAEMRETIENYVKENVVVHLGNSQVLLSLTSIVKTEDNVCQVVLKGDVKNLPNYQTVSIKNTLLFSSFDKQSNVLHLYVDSEKKQILRFFKGVPLRIEKI
ncbi:DUF6702 family protein [Wenyingzhuangia sp. IMCC45467]